jgi:hypothetical protein
MAKGPEKNTKNKALHTKLLNRKNVKLQEEKKEKALRLKALVIKMNQKRVSNRMLDELQSAQTFHSDIASNKVIILVSYKWVLICEI